MENYEALFDERLNEYIDLKIAEGKSKFVICPMGVWGRRGKALLKKRGLEPVACLDNNYYNMKTVYPLDKFVQEKESDMEILVLTISESVEKELLEQIELYQIGKVGFIAREEINRKKERENELQMIRDLKRENPLELDFLCVGFQKCATTSLHLFLDKNENIELPKMKETFFLCDISRKSNEALHSYYDVEKKAVLRGGIEPVYARMGRYVKEYFGERLKIIFCIRNPIKAGYSYAKMNMRNVSTDLELNMYKKYNVPCIEMIKEIMEEVKENFCYSDYIEEWLKYYPKQQIKFIVSEEMFREPNRIMKELQLAIGLSEDQVLECKVFPHLNEGAGVTKDYASAKIVFAMSCVAYNYRYGSKGTREALAEMRNEVFKETLIEFNENLPQDYYDELLEYYMPSIKRLEEIMGRSLEGLWY